MPIRPEQRSKYPKDWAQITARIRVRAGDRCECTGECGAAHIRGGRCNAPNRALIRRDPEDPADWFKHEHSGACLGEDCDAVTVTLTVAHLNHDPSDNDEARNLRALCNRCHLVLDLDEHRTNAAATRLKNKEAASGQTRLF